MKLDLGFVLLQLSALAVFIHLWLAYAAIKRRNDVADVAWGLGFVLIAAMGFVFNPNTRTAVALTLVSVWGCRLAWHIWRRFRRRSDEDPRYQEMRRGWKSQQLLFSWITVFLNQGLFLVLVAMPLLILPHYATAPWTTINSAGLALWLFGFSYEAIADEQLRRFILNPSKPAGQRIMKSGLWKFSRHPNYFGEATIWWGMWLITFGGAAWLTVIGPLTITWLLRFVSGVPLAEKSFAGDAEFEAYKRGTPAMLPDFRLK